MKNIAFIICVIFISINSFAQNTLQSEIDSLVEVLVKERRQWNNASNRLKVIGEPAVDELLEVLLDEKIDSWPRRKAAMTLSGINSEKKIDSCIKLFLDITEEISVRRNACNALQGVDIDRYEDLFIKMSKDENEDIRSVSYMRLGDIGTKNAIERLISVTEEESDMTQWIILHILESIETTEVDQLFLNVLIEDNWWMLDEYIAKILVRRGEKVIDSLVIILNDSQNSEFLRWEAIWIIKDIDGPKSREILQQALNDENFYFRNEAEVYFQNQQK
jgi:HEAT repeat protein